MTLLRRLMLWAAVAVGLATTSPTQGAPARPVVDAPAGVGLLRRRQMPGQRGGAGDALDDHWLWPDVPARVRTLLTCNGAAFYQASAAGNFTRSDLFDVDDDRQ